jgi:predicted AlkP superfamily pyrophosphatase or phosphodiesterase
LIDSLSHQRGPSSSVIDAEMHSWTAMMQQEFLDRLSPAAATGTVLTFVSDHGQVDVSPADVVRLNQHPQLMADLLMKPVGEARLPFLYARQGRAAAIQRYVREHLDHAFVVLDSARALEAGLFGSQGSLAPETAARLGDLILVSRRNHILYDREDEFGLSGLHGGLSAEEMLVPFMITRLDG